VYRCSQSFGPFAVRCDACDGTVDRYIMLYELIAGESFDFDAEKAAAGFARHYASVLRCLRTAVAWKLFRPSVCFRVKVRCGCGPNGARGGSTPRNTVVGLFELGGA
jgi:hypothetical protein